MDALSIALGLAVKQGVFVLGQHLGLGGHLGLPPLHGRQHLPLLGERGVNGRNDAVDGPEALTVPPLLELGQPPGDLPQETAGQRVCDSEWAKHRLSVWR